MVAASIRRTAIAFAFAAIAITPSFVFAAGVSISPLKFEYTIESTKEQSGIVKVTNNTDSVLTLYTSKEDFIAGDAAGTPTFIKAKDKTTDEFALSNWISLSEDHSLSPKGESKRGILRGFYPTECRAGWTLRRYILRSFSKRWIKGFGRTENRCPYSYQCPWKCRD